MPVDDLWFPRIRDPVTGERQRSQRHGRGKRWRVRWTEPETGERKADAERRDANMHADISRGQYVDPRAAGLRSPGTASDGGPGSSTGTRRPTWWSARCGCTSCPRWATAGWPTSARSTCGATPREAHLRPARLLFTTANGLPLYRSNWSAVWRVAVRRAGLPAGFGLHGLRHYFATLLIHNGASVKTVQLALGHSTPMITLNTYAHEWPDALDRTRTLVDAALGRAAVGGAQSS
jgi:hypothetical protein